MDAEVLRERLNNPDPSVRREALEALSPGGCLDLSLIPLIASALNDTEEYIREGALWLLGENEHRAAEYLPEIGARLHDPSPAVRYYAILALQNIGGPLAEATLPVLLGLLNDNELGVRDRASHAIEVLFGHRVVEAISDASSRDLSGNRNSGDAAATALAELVRCASAEVDTAEFSSHSKEKRRLIALGVVLRKQGSFEEIRVLLEDEDADVRRYGTRLVSHMIGSLFAYLIRSTTDADASTREESVFGFKDHNYQDVVVATQHLLQDPDPEVRFWAISALEVLAYANRARASISENLANADRDVRFAASQALQEMFCALSTYETITIDRLSKALSSSDEGVVFYASQILSAISSLGGAAATALEQHRASCRKKE